MNDLVARIERLERSQRRARAVAVFAGLALVTLAAVRSADAKPDAAPHLKVGKLELVDADGKVRARLAVEDDGGAAMTVFDSGEGRKAVLSVLKSGSPGLVLRNAAGKGQFIASIGEDGPVMLLCTKDGAVGTSLTLRDEDSTSLLGMRVPPDKTMRAVLSVMKDLRGYVKVVGPDGELRVFGKPEIEFTPAMEK